MTTGTTNTTARMFAGYYRELVASGLPRGLAQSMVVEAAASNRFPEVHPDALAAVDTIRDRALSNKTNDGRAETMRRHPAYKGGQVHVNIQESPRAALPMVDATFLNARRGQIR